MKTVLALGLSVALALSTSTACLPQDDARVDAAVIEALIEHQHFRVAVQAEQDAPEGEERRNAREVTDSRLADFNRKTDAVQTSLLPPQAADRFEAMRTNTETGLASARELVDEGGRSRVRATWEYQELSAYNQSFVRLWADLLENRPLAQWIYAHDDVLALSIAISAEIQAGQAVLDSMAVDDDHAVDVNISGFGQDVQFTDTALSTAATSVGYLGKRDLVAAVTAIPSDVLGMRSNLQGVSTAETVEADAWTSGTRAWQAAVAQVDRDILDGALGVANKR
jgi:hypothetical protein